MHNIIEVGLELPGNAILYHQNLIKYKWVQAEVYITHDIYYSKLTSFDGMTEQQIKDSCKRVRICHQKGTPEVQHVEELKQEAELRSQGYRKVFDTTKVDYQYTRRDKKSRIQLQEIEGFGLVLYYANPDYACYEEKEQRIVLIQELNMFGFEFDIHQPNFDKLRSLYNRKRCYSAG